MSLFAFLDIAKRKMGLTIPAILSESWLYLWLNVSTLLLQWAEAKGIPSILPTDGKTIITVMQETDIDSHKRGSVHSYHLASNHTGTPATKDRRKSEKQYKIRISVSSCSNFRKHWRLMKKTIISPPRSNY